MSVSIIQFMKGDLYAGEWDGIKKLGDKVELISTVRGFVAYKGIRFHMKNIERMLSMLLNLQTRRWNQGRSTFLSLMR